MDKAKRETEEDLYRQLDKDCRKKLTYKMGPEEGQQGCKKFKNWISNQ